MNKKKRLILCCAAALVFLTVFVGYPVYAKDHSARLKDCLQSECIYLSTSIYELSSGIINDKYSFKNDFDDHCVVISGLTVDSFSAYRLGVTVKDSAGNKCYVNTANSSIKIIADKLNVGDRVAVYGKVSVTGLMGDSYEIVAKDIIIGDKSIPEGSFVNAAGKVYKGVTVDSISDAGIVSYTLPEAWNNTYTTSELTNNGIHGFQYYLNAIPPQDMEYPEVFSIFYFNNETYLEKVPTNPTDGDNKDIEEAIVRNILQDLDGKFKVKMKSFKDINGTKIDYYSTSYRPKDGHDYRLEFLFRPGKKGITCMLYIYFPTEAAVKHVDEAAFLVESIQMQY